MGRKCCVPGCRSNYATEKTYTPVFLFPQDEQRRALWIKNINRADFNPSVTAVVCVNHFSEDVIIREDRVTRSDGTLLVVPRKKLGLTADAYPTIFLNQPSYLTVTDTAGAHACEISHTAMVITNNDLPSNFKNEIVSNSQNQPVRIRSDLASMEDINFWVKEFGEKTSTSWNSRTTQPCGEKFVCSKKFVCHHSSFMKVRKSSRLSKNANCPASIAVKIKLNTLKTRKTDQFVKKGLCAVIVINGNHTHSLHTAETLHFLQADETMKEKFFRFFDSGMGIAESSQFHERVLEVQRYTEEDFANGRVNPTKRTVRYWHDQWKLQNLGPRSGLGLIEFESQPAELFEGVPHSLESHESLDSILSLLSDCNSKFGSSSSGLQKMRERLEKIRSVGQWEKFLHTAGTHVPLRRRDGVSIGVQPASLARRSAHITRGSKRLPSGQPAKDEGGSKKRKQSLVYIVKLSKPNAKSHCGGH